MDTSVENILIFIVLFLVVASFILLFFFLKQRRMIHISPLVQHNLKSQMQSRAKVLKEFYENVYYSCDNFPKYAGKLSGYLSKSFEDGSLKDFVADMVFVVNIAEGGAFEKMAKEYSLTESDVRTCCYIHLGFTWQQACTAEKITENAYNVRCSRVRKKLGLEREEKIADFVAHYCSRYSTVSERI